MNIAKIDKILVLSKSSLNFKFSSWVFLPSEGNLVGATELQLVRRDRVVFEGLVGFLGSTNSAIVFEGSYKITKNKKNPHTSIKFRWWNLQYLNKFSVKANRCLNFYYEFNDMRCQV